MADFETRANLAWLTNWKRLVPAILLAYRQHMKKLEEGIARFDEMHRLRR